MSSLKRYLRFLLHFFLGSIGAIIGVLTIGKTFLNLPIRQSVGLGILIYASLFAFYVLFLCLRSLIISIKKQFVTSVWGTAIILRDKVFADINAVRRQPYNESSAVKVLVNACNEIKTFFDSHTGSETSVSIKIPIISNVDIASMEMRNLCRDSQHFSRDNDRYKSISHNVVGNTPYSWIVSELKENKKSVYYCNNDIERTKDYRNTSKSCYPNERLPYNSEIVVPIIAAKQDGRNAEICGFLCIDSANTNVFNPDNYDYAFLAGIADGIYDLVKSIITSQNQ